jgi:hypothetical protein
MMLEHLSHCDYFQFEWNELNIELLTPDFDVDTDKLMEIIDYGVKLELFQIEYGWITSSKLLERNLPFMGERKGFNMDNSPIMKLKADLLNKSENNSVNQPINTQSKVKENKLNESKVEESKTNQTKLYESIEEEIELEEYQTERMLNGTADAEDFNVKQIKYSLDLNRNIPTEIKQIVFQMVDGPITRTQVEKLDKNKHYFNKFNDIVNKYNDLFNFKIFKDLNDKLQNEFVIK